jgi:hypothetical protein
VPLGYADIAKVKTDNIPGPLPGGWEGHAISATIDMAEYISSTAGSWGQPSQQAFTQKVALTGEAFFALIGDQHSHNSYLHLLGATQIANDAAGTSPMTGTICPPYVTTPNLVTS